MFQRGGFQSFGRPVKATPMGQAPTPGPKPILPHPQSPEAAAKNQPKGFIPKSPGSSSCPICR